MSGGLRSAVSILMAKPARDPLDVGIESGVKIIFSEPVFSNDMKAWKCIVTFEGSVTTEQKGIYGESGLQSLMLAAQFADTLYPESFS